MGLYIPCGNAQTMWSCLCEMCHCLLDNFPQCQHQQRRITTLSAPTTTPDSQPPHHKRMQVKGSNDACRRLGPKCKFSTVIFYVLLTVLHRFATIDIAHPCSVPTSSILTLSVHTSSVPTPPPRTSACSGTTGLVATWQRTPSAATPHSTTNPPTSHCSQGGFGGADGEVAANGGQAAKASNYEGEDSKRL